MNLECPFTIQEITAYKRYVYYDVYLFDINNKRIGNLYMRSNEDVIKSNEMYFDIIGVATMTPPTGQIFDLSKKYGEETKEN